MRVGGWVVSLPAGVVILAREPRLRSMGGGLYKPRHPKSLGGQSKAVRLNRVAGEPDSPKPAFHPGQGPPDWLGRQTRMLAPWLAGCLAGVPACVVVSSVVIFLGGQTQASAEIAPLLAGPANRCSREFHFLRINACLFALDVLRLFCGDGDFRVLRGQNLEVEARCMRFCGVRIVHVRQIRGRFERLFRAFLVPRHAGRLEHRLDSKIGRRERPHAGRDVLHMLFDVFQVSEILDVFKCFYILKF